MTASNKWALVVGAVVALGAVGGGVVWHRDHPDVSPVAQLAKLTGPVSSPQPPAPASKPAPPLSAPRPSGGAGLVKGPLPPPEPAAGHGEPPHFDVVRVEPSGDAVLAGKGDPNADVSLLSSGKVVAKTKADPTGQFVLMPPALGPGDHDLTLRQKSEGKPTVDSKQNIAVSVPSTPDGKVVVAMAEPGKPTKLISGPPEAPAAGTPPPAAANAPPPPQPPAAAAPPPEAPAQVAAAKPETAVALPTPIKPAGPDLAIRSVELENGNGFFASGVAPADTRIQIYLNEAHLADVVAGPDGQWSVTVRKGLTGGHYVVRADASSEGHAVTARVEVPFDVPVAMAEAAKPAEAPKPSAPPPTELAGEIPNVPADQPVAEAPKPSAPPPTELAGEIPNVPADQPAVEAPKPTEPPAKVAAEMAHEPPPPKAAPAAPVTPPEPTPKVIARSTPPEPPSVVPTPRPDVAAAAKAAAAKAPAVAPPVLAVSPPTPPAATPTPPASRMAVSPPRPADAAPTLSAAAPTVAPPKQAEITAGAPVAAATPASPPASTTEPAHAPDPAHAVIEQVETAVVVRGDNLWNISRARLGFGHRYTQIYAANLSQIRDPKLIYPGQVFVVPQR